MGSLVEPPGLDPFHQAADARIRLTVLMYQGLFYESPDGEAMPLLAESYDVSAQRLDLHDQAAQGRQVPHRPGDDREGRGLQLRLHPRPEERLARRRRLRDDQAIEVVDEQTVRITLYEPNASLPMTLGNKYGAVIPAGYFDAPDAKTKLNQASVGTGPFKLVEFKPNSNLACAGTPITGKRACPISTDQFRLPAERAGMLVGLHNKRLDLAT